MSRTVTNTTIQNHSKYPRLNTQHIVPSHHVASKEVATFLTSLDSYDVPKCQLLFSIGADLLGDNSNPAVRSFLGEYRGDRSKVDNVPLDAFDLLGSAYQYLNSKKENLEKGSFYTGQHIAEDLVLDLNFSEGQIIFDPSCGSGSFLFRSAAGPEQVYGVDSDPVAVMIAKFNYFIKFPEAGPPNLFCTDFFEWHRTNPNLRFDYVIGNPPYGANIDLALIPSSHVSSGESFSYFIELGYGLLKPDGLFRYLIPESLLNVKRHTDIRDFLLDRANLKRIKRYSAKFSSVMSDIYLIELDKGSDNSVLFEDGSRSEIPKSVFRGLKNRVFVQLRPDDLAIIENVNALRCFDLTQSTFALGVVTGDNKTKLFDEPRPGAEHIYTGKEVERYALLPPRSFICFDRAALQQVAPEACYRAPAKLVYKTISKRLKVALDTSGSLTTNSANIIIPKIPGYDIRTVMALLNSDLYSYLYSKLFGGVNKIGKEHLMALPFPMISEDQDSRLVELTGAAADSGDDTLLMKYIHEDLFGLNSREIEYITASAA